MLADYNKCADIFKQNELEMSHELYEKLDIYANFLVEYNKKVNLTAITEPDDILIKHFADSIVLLNHVNVPRGTLLADIGTGAGFPSVPLKLYRDDIEITMIDSLQKRITFLSLLCEKLGISADLVHGRAEDVAKNPKYREKFDVVTARAVSAMPVLSEYCIPYVKVGGVFAAMKTPHEDISGAGNAIKLLGGKISDDILYNLSDGQQRRIIITQKISHTSTKYPRNSGQIKAKSL